MVERRNLHYVVLICLALLTVIAFSCQNNQSNKEKVIGKATIEKQGDLGEILKNNKLTVLAENSATSYFIYRGHKMGLEYEILNEFAKELGVKLEIKVVKDLDNIIENLNDGEGDIIACNYTVTKERKSKIDFTIPIMRTSQVLVQRKPEDWRTRRKSDWKKDVIQDPAELSRKTIHVWKNSSYYDRLVNLQDELGDTIIIEPLDGNVIPEDVIEMVSEGFIDFTVTDENVASINKRYFQNIDVDLELSVKQRIAFGVRKQSPLLRKKLNAWLEDFMKTSTFNYIKYKYLNNSSNVSKSKSDYSSISGTKISPYDQTIKVIAGKYNWDWRLIAALIYQESKFKLGLQSWAGAYGLMQFMPTVGPTFGVYPDSPPTVQIDGGIRKIVKNYNEWESIPDSIQRVKFTFATYNAGIGHVLDAQRLAKKYGKDPLVWDDNVEIYIKNLSNPKYYHDPVCYYGYMRGSETYNYVRSIFIRYTEYKTAFPTEI
ncbi:MltF family protein [Brumimicrobium aurantiacum]|uniref:Lytic transglycosylase F n=1 Tax=Brumimicrobium aurantiacum TaxID=1737063 RepID=A0A3E1EZH6_9FLAO|nr:transporter substrate-binding domain-containing protein [Brumimicrobium aurantiacum]RFC54883.1 lytic transglycosylase F [Brumimicrobium aurantiacum]